MGVVQRPRLSNREAIGDTFRGASPISSLMKYSKSIPNSSESPTILGCICMFALLTYSYIASLMMIGLFSCENSACFASFFCSSLSLLNSSNGRFENSFRNHLATCDGSEWKSTAKARSSKLNWHLSSIPTLAL